MLARLKSTATAIRRGVRVSSGVTGQHRNQCVPHDAQRGFVAKDANGETGATGRPKMMRSDLRRSATRTISRAGDPTFVSRDQWSVASFEHAVS